MNSKISTHIVTMAMDPQSRHTRICSKAALQEPIHCPSIAVAGFYNTMGRQIWLGNTLLLVSAAMAAVMVGIGGYGRRYRHHRFTRSIFLGANTVFLPFISYVVSSLSDSSNDYASHNDRTTLAAVCDSILHPCMVITCAFLVQIAAINTISVVAIDSREGRRLRPPPELLLKGIWICYLGASITNKRFFHGLFQFSPSENHELDTVICSKIMFAPFALMCAKILFKCYSFQKARKSFALGRNPSLVFGYMQQLPQQERSQHGGGGAAAGEDPLPPPLLVMGEDSRKVEKQPWGYVFSDSWTPSNDSIGLVTLDTVWQLEKMLPTSKPRPKDLCLSFALFKLLRCRFARYDLTDVGSRGLNFFWSLLLKDGEHDRVFRVIADELSFLNDYYYSSLPVSYSKSWLPILSIFISILSIGYCIVAAHFIVVFAAQVHMHKQGRYQIQCEFWCTKLQDVSEPRNKRFGSLYFDVIPEFLLLILVLIAEVRDVSSYICSNWTKVALICCSVKSAALQQSLGMKKWVVCLLLQCKWKIVNHWDEKIGQCSVLVLHPTGSTTLLGLLRRLLHLPDHKTKVKLPTAVKICIMDALRSAASSDGCHLGNGRTSLHRSQVGKSFLWACNGKSTSDIILIWHIATCILEVRHPLPMSDKNKIAATHLSRYCAYLMTWSPDLLPEEVAWSKGLYEDVKEDAARVLSARAAMRSSTPESEYHDLVQLLSEGSRHLVLKDGVWLGKQLVGLDESEETAWAVLAGFWAEMMLYVAPSNNLKGHKKAIARGGELITLLWALLFHAGIVSRLGETGSTATSDSDGGV